MYKGGGGGGSYTSGVRGGTRFLNNFQWDESIIYFSDGRGKQDEYVDNRDIFLRESSGGGHSGSTGAHTEVAAEIDFDCSDGYAVQIVT